MQQHDEAARRERQRAAGMRRWPSSLFLADQQYFRILESPELNRCEFSEAVSDVRGEGRTMKWSESTRFLTATDEPPDWVTGALLAFGSRPTCIC
ncbi:hypothetical protein niasHS_016131 [Heterodera schachtii]|uniref:Uncharacterized protein n=1 Tax=Heterodera schachtii TaxID=97005 RepID=A0ABD2HQR2_HETSC